MNEATVNKRIYIAATGAGAGAQHDIWSVPGCSKYFVGAAFPYATDQTDEFIGYKVDKYVSEETAIAMAMESYKRAWNGTGCEGIGVGLSASVASLTQHRGEHEIWASVMNDFHVYVAHRVLKKGQGESARKRDGNKADKVIDSLIRIASGKRATGFEYSVATTRATDLFFKKPFFDSNGYRWGHNPYRGVTDPVAPLYFGAFNPPHQGHLQIAQAAGPYTVFGITQDSPHKPDLTLANLLQRAKLLKGRRVLFTRGDPLYIDKARLAPGSTFVIGCDALKRMLDPKWGPDVKEMLYEFVSLYTTLLVAPRIVDGQLLTMNQVLDSCGVDFQVRHDLFKELKGFEPVEMSSSQIRGEK